MALVVEQGGVRIDGAQISREVETAAGIYLHRIGIQGTAQNQVKIATAAGAGAILGVLTGPAEDTDGLIADGESCDIDFLGAHLVKAAGTITLGAQVISDSTLGKGLTISGATVWVLGHALDTSATDDEIPVMIFIMRRSA